MPEPDSAGKRQGYFFRKQKNYTSASLPVFLSVCLSFYLSFCLSVCRYLCLCLSVSVFGSIPAPQKIAGSLEHAEWRVGRFEHLLLRLRAERGAGSLQHR